MYYFRRCLLVFALCSAVLPAFSRPLRVLATGDMHGWLQDQPVDGQRLGGAAEMLAYWKKVEKYRPKDFLVLGCGDFNTGPVLATVFKGDPVVSVMNLMGYDACALGNHEFDFGAESFARWAGSARFPLLAANLTKKDGVPADHVRPYLLYDEQGVSVGVIGLITTDLHTQTNNAGAFTVQAYAKTLRQLAPELRAKGARVIVVVTHVPQDELTRLAEQVRDLDIPLMLGAHSHEFAQAKIGNTWVVSNGENWQSYSRIDLDHNVKSGKTVVLSAKQVWLQQEKPAADKSIVNEIARWQQRMAAEYNAPIGYSAAGLQRPHAVYNFVCDCTLAADATADIVLLNNGSMRQDLPAGPISKGSIVGVMPFANSLYRIKLTGAQLLAYLPKGGFIGVAGIRYAGKQYLLEKTGQPLGPGVTYTVLLNNYMYDVSAALKAADPHPATVCYDWRQPVYDWLEQHPTSKENPLETLIDAKPRM